MPQVDDAIVTFIRDLLWLIVSLVRAGNDKTAREEVMMTMQETVKAALDREKFSDESVVSIKDPDSQNQDSEKEGKA